MEIINQPLVSVIIPTYERTSFLKLTLESVQNQTYNNIEIIVVDDGSQDDNNEILCKSFDKIKYIKIKNSGGPAKPRNKGIKEATGKYIAFLDDDDLWLPEKLTKQVAILNKNLDFGLVHSYCDVIDENGFKQNEIIGRPSNINIKHGDVSMRMIGNWTVMMPTPLVRKSIIDKVGFFNEKMPSAGEDMEYWVRCSFETKFYYLDEPLALYRIHDANISSDSKKYINLPLYLKKVAENVYSTKKIDRKSFHLLIKNICQFQIRTVKGNLIKTLKNLFLIDLFWYLKKNNCKMILFILFQKQQSINKKNK